MGERWRSFLNGPRVREREEREREGDELQITEAVERAIGEEATILPPFSNFDRGAFFLIMQIGPIYLSLLPQFLTPPRLLT